jgi:hypothetical protein
MKKKYVFTQEHRDNLSKAGKGKKFPGRTIPPEQRTKISKSMKQARNEKQCADSEMHSRYRKVRVNGKEMPLHRHVMEQTLGRPLQPFEYVHHINGNRYDNRPENLQLVTPKEHSAYHPMKFSLETRAKLSATSKGRKFPGRVLSQERKDQISESMRLTRKEHPEYWRKLYTKNKIFSG